jgi:diguanylate cyclase (GGDEF)-like protein
MQRSIDGKIAMLSFCAIAAAVSTIVFVVIWMAIEHNNKAARDAKTMVAGGFAAIEESVKTFAIDYAWWQDAYDNIRAGNEEWIASNMGGAVTENESLQLVAIADPEGAVKFAWVAGSGEESDASAVPAELARQAHGALSGIPASTNEAAGFVTKIGDLHFTAATARVVPQSGNDTDPKGSWSIILGLSLDQDRVGGLGKSYLLDDLTLVTKPASGQSSVLVAGKQGSPDAVYLAWNHLTPGFDLLQMGGVPIALAILVFSFLSLFIARKANISVVSLARKEEESYVAARTDVLTGLANRLKLLEMIESGQVLKACSAGEFAAIFIDVDGFKRVNDTVGHDGGDELIREVGVRLSACVPASAFVARVGGDEFNVILKTRETTANVSVVAHDINNAFRKEFAVKGKRFSLAASVGYAVSQGSETLPSELLRRADVAMYEAKGRKTGEPLRYSEMFETKIKSNLEIGEALRDALATGQVHVHYQPIVKTATSELVAVEALVRWHSPDLGTVSPVDFIPVAEDVGLIGELDTYVFNRVCEDLATWPELRASVNVSPIQLRHPGYVTSVIEAAAKAGIDACRLELELTERILLSHPEIANEKLTQLRTAGFSISLDDFGTGYSSIGYLKRMPFDKLKIDRSFVINMEHDPNAIAMVQNITGLAKALGLTVVAEGVETVEQANIVRLAGCDQMQGFLLGMPVPFEEIEARYRVEDEARKLMLEKVVSI